jgi:histidinol dehydrogenase
VRVIKGFEETKKALTRRVAPQTLVVSPRLAISLKAMFGTEDPQTAVVMIIDEVRRSGDAALKEYSRKISGVALESVEVPRDEIAAACNKIPRELLFAIETAGERVKTFHKKQFNAFMSGVKKMAPGTVARVLDRIGLYVPGGTASYPSSVLMTAIPARAAGVREIIVCTPPGKDGRIPDMTLAAAFVAGVDRVFAVGGAQAIAAMAYGTQTVPAVDKICGPGNIFVMLAKKQVYGTVDIDGLQGPSEVIVIADANANPSWCAADILAQAEHDGMAQCVFVTTSDEFAAKMMQEVETQAETLSRKAIIDDSLQNYGIVCVVDNLEQAIELANRYAPEHLCLYVKNYDKIVNQIKNAGCVFVGTHPTVVMGDYVAGPSHALPTGGTARFASPLNTTDFIRLMNVVEVDSKMLAKYGPVAATLADAEGLTAHAKAVGIAADNRR